MTLTKNMSDKCNRNVMKANEALRSVIVQAGTTDRLTRGVLPCTKLLHSCPDRIMLCILPTPEELRPFDHVHQKLIEAFCRENRVKLLRVDSVQKLGTILQSNCAPSIPTTVEDQATNARQDDMSDAACLLIEYPAALSREDDFVLAYHDTLVYCHVTPLPLVRLPE